ncbi:glycosyltransferase family 4 protein [Sphingomonas nostoxanthinifaciens]|uniref:glycosyltransferase family 4 protein n=1 Tax=Sphingomonas nostoxanthinifaciens TaxID=2872652 RepID=UPI001CC1F1A2|nr:glycosyltransferase family 1 protein [Sphingomonas nostoxanthinifaciens]UAK23266.1 glycosyltransferase family 4 protein [Sphingomonas nostoxanthinifaciens]
MPDPATGPQNIVINGRFLSQRLSGVQRYAREITQALDALIAADPQGLGRNRWRLAAPIDATCDLPLTAIEVEKVGTRTGHVWEQWELLRAARGARLVNLGNSGPVLHPDMAVVIHDVAVFRTPENFGARYARAHRILGRVLARRAQIGTVSEFSRGEIADVLRVPERDIFVARNGCDHLRRVTPDEVLRRLGLTEGGYFLFVGSPTRNKNLAQALTAFAQLGRPDIRFVIAGSLAKAVFGDVMPADVPGVMVVPGLPDGGIAGLYAHAAALVFPSRYEGFGIPPLEAMVNGCPVLAADIPVLREVCGDAATYFPLDDADALAGRMAQILDQPERRSAAAEAGHARAARFTWASAARDLAQAITSPRA